MYIITYHLHVCFESFPFVGLWDCERVSLVHVALPCSHQADVKYNIPNIFLSFPSIKRPGHK